MPFTKLIWFMLGMVKESTQNALERFFPKLKETTSMSQQAFSLARQKIKWEAFQELFQASVEGSYNEEAKGWNGWHLMAIDSSHIALPRDAQLGEYYGAAGKELSAPAARASILYDIENDIIVDARLEKLSVGERILAKEHIQALERIREIPAGWKIIVIFDRGYPSKELIKYVQGKGIQYVMRVQKGFSSRIDKMKKGSRQITLGEGILVRALVFRLSSGEREMLITNIREDEIADEAFPELYYRRWPIETKYDQLKKKLELENFSGRLVDNIKQDFYAMMTLSNMLASILREANEKIREEEATKEVKYKYRANVNHAIGVLKDKLIAVLIAKGRLARTRLYDELVLDIKRRTIPIRPDRNPPRKEYHKKPHFDHNHKSNC